MLKHLIKIFLVCSVLTAQSITPVGLDLIKHYESFKSEAYLCPAKVLTIGYGSTGTHVKAGMRVTELQATLLLKKDVKRFESHIKNRVSRLLIWNEFDALTSFTFNVGYRVTKGLQTFVNQGNTNGVIMKLMQYNKAKVNGVYIILKGLTKRRISESTLYRDGVLAW
ncbi:MAG TPA: lysozyme [Candidatus Nanoarchaeia archaeon]|nr:lysozyme [Candidatus Nanoarchaeia archaeon]